MRQGVVRIDGWWSVLFGVAVLAAVAPVGADQPAPGPSSLRLSLAFTTALALPAGVSDAAVREMQQIWRREGVAIDVVARGEASSTAPAMRVLIVSAGGTASGRHEHSWPVAELVGDGQGKPMALASLSAARRVVEAAGLTNRPDALVARHLGVVLGRAIAHEIGHHLLNTAAHARHGLMRARIAARDFADLRDGGFDLDAAAAQWARARLTRPPADALQVARFVYRP